MMKFGVEFFAYADGKYVATAMADAMHEDNVPLESYISLGRDGTIQLPCFNNIQRQSRVFLSALLSAYALM